MTPPVHLNPSIDMIQKHRISTLVAALALAFCAAAPAWAQDNAAASDVNELERVTVTLGRGQLRSVQGLTTPSRAPARWPPSRVCRA